MSRGWEDQDTTWTQEEGDEGTFQAEFYSSGFLLLSSALLINLPSTKHLYATPVQVDFPLHFLQPLIALSSKSMNLTCSGWIKIITPYPPPLCFSATISSPTLEKYKLFFTLCLTFPRPIPHACQILLVFLQPGVSSLPPSHFFLSFFFTKVQIFFFFLIFGHTARHVGCQFPDQAPNRCSLQWEHGVFFFLYLFIFSF